MSQRLILSTDSNVPPIFGTGTRPYLYGVGMLTTLNMTEHTDGQGGTGFAGLDPWGWSSTDVRFVRGRYSWDFCEPTEGQYNWQGIDDMFARCHLNSKYGSFNVSAGTLTPQWVYDSGAIRYYTHSALNDEQFTDGVENSTTTLVSASAKFKHGYDEGLSIVGAPGIPSSTTIVSVTNPTTIVMSHAATLTGTGKTFTIKARMQPQPLPWDTAYQAKWFNFLDALAARYASEPLFLNYVVCGFMTEAGMSFGDSIDYGNPPQATGFTPMSAYLTGPNWAYGDVGAAYIAGAQAVIDKTMQVLPAQRVVVTYVKPFDTSPAPLTEIQPVHSSVLGGQIKSYMQDNFPTKGGFMVSSIFSDGLFGPPTIPQTGSPPHGFPSGRQQFWLTTHAPGLPVPPARNTYKSGSYNPPYATYPDDPIPFADMVGNCVASTGLFMETYQADISNTAIRPLIPAATASMAAIVPVDG